MKLWSSTPFWGQVPPWASFAILLVCICTTLSISSPAAAQRRPKSEPAAEAKAAPNEAKPAKGKDEKPTKDASGKPKVFDFTGIDLAGRLHTPQLLYFLERANEELERAFLERRSFIPHMVRSLDEEAL